MKWRSVLVTGSAGFLGFHLCRYLLENKKADKIIGIDNLNSYYSPLLKERRNSILKKQYEEYFFIKMDFSDYDALKKIMHEQGVDIIVHLGAQAGVRYSLRNPWVYEASNIKGTLAVFEAAREAGIKKVVYASSSSVYGKTSHIPFTENDPCDKPLSLYAATKRANELMAYTYYSLYGIEMIGLRFFTVYGEYGRPDMAYWKFAEKIMKEEVIEIYNYGKMMRDFTYVSDAVKGIVLAMECSYKYDVFNIGNDNPVGIEYLISLLEEYLHKKALKKYLPMQPGEVEKTWADLTKSRSMLGYSPEVPIEEGLKRFSKWFLDNWDWIKGL